jgi:hypothetical protein
MLSNSIGIIFDNSGSRGVQPQGMSTDGMRNLKFVVINTLIILVFVKCVYFELNLERYY